MECKHKMPQGFISAQKKIHAMRGTGVAKTFYVSCALAGFHRGWTQSKTSLRGHERLCIDRLSWAALYSGLYAWCHPIVFYCLLQKIEINTRKVLTPSYTHDDGPNILKILDVPHLQEYVVYKKKY